MISRRRTGAALALAVVLASACSGDEVADPAASSTPAPAAPASSAPPTAPSTPTDAPADATAPRVGEPRDLGEGIAIGAAPDGLHLWVHAPDTGSTDSCEGADFEFLWTVDVATGERRRALDVPDDQHPQVGTIAIAPGDPGTVLLVGECEGFLSSAHLATLAPDGTMSELTELPLPEVELRPRTLRWLGDDQLMAVGNTDEAFGELFVHQVGSDGWDDLGTGDHIDWLPLGDGLAAEVLFDQVALVGEDGTVLDSIPANAIVRAPGGGFPLLATRYDAADAPGALLLVRPGGVQERLAGTAGLAPSFSPDGTHVAWSELPSSEDADASPMTTRIRSLEHGSEVAFTDGWFSGVQWLTGAIAYTAEGALDDNGFPRPLVRVRDFTPGG